MSISNIISEYSKTVEIKDVNLIEEDIDDIIVKLYKEFNIWQGILVILNYK